MDYRFFAIGLGGVLLLSLLGGCSQQTIKKAPSSNCVANVELNKLAHSFGTIQHGEEVAATFWIKNVGECPYIIKEIKTTCGCTSAQFSNKPTLMNDSIAVLLYFNTKGFSGTQIKHVSILDNTGTGEQLLMLTANVN